MLFAMVAITVFMTAFYIFRVIFLTFTGEYKGGAPDEHGHAHSHLHESPPVMIFPMLVLAVLAIFSGLWNVGGGFNAFFGEGETQSFFTGLFGVFTHSALPGIALLIALLGIFLAYAVYGAKWISNESIGRTFKPLYNIFYRKYFIDELYQDIIVKKVLLGGIFAGMQKVDTYVVDGAVNGAAKLTNATGRALRQAQSGQVQAYAIVIGIGIVAIALVILFLG